MPRHSTTRRAGQRPTATGPLAQVSCYKPEGVRMAYTIEVGQIKLPVTVKLISTKLIILTTYPGRLALINDGACQVFQGKTVEHLYFIEFLH